MIIYQYRIYRKDLKANRDVLYVFGDNLDRQGYGGQAAEIRGEPNAFGIATKRGIGHGFPDDYFFDTQEDAQVHVDNDFANLLKEYREGKYKMIVWPLEGIGTGLSRLHA